jgi:hypothetical protein
METPRLLRLPVETTVEDADVSAAIELVASGHARRVVLIGLPDVDAVAGAALARAQAAGVAFALSRDPRSGTLAAVVGPREA